MNARVNRRAALTTSRRSFIAGWKLCAGVALGLCFRSSWARAQILGPPPPPGSGPPPPPPGSGPPPPPPGSGPPPPPGAGPGPSCFLVGTRIKTTEGEINIEELRIGDNVLTTSSKAKPIKFIGRTKVVRERTGAWSGDGPVKISRFAIDGKAPHADLYVSPWHAIYIDNMLIPVKYLVNGVTIVADTKPEALSLTYFHIELDTHDAIFAEGLAVESFLRDDPYAFDNADEYVRLYGSPEGPLTPFAPYTPYTRRRELASHIRSALAPVYDLRNPIDRVRDRIADHADFAQAA